MTIPTSEAVKYNRMRKRLEILEDKLEAIQNLQHEWDLAASIAQMSDDYRSTLRMVADRLKEILEGEA